MTFTGLLFLSIGVSFALGAESLAILLIQAGIIFSVCLLVVKLCFMAYYFYLFFGGKSK